MEWTSAIMPLLGEVPPHIVVIIYMLHKEHKERKRTDEKIVSIGLILVNQMRKNKKDCSELDELERQIRGGI